MTLMPLIGGDSPPSLISVAVRSPGSNTNPDASLTWEIEVYRVHLTGKDCLLAKFILDSIVIVLIGNYFSSHPNLRLLYIEPVKTEKDAEIRCCSMS